MMNGRGARGMDKDLRICKAWSRVEEGTGVKTESGPAVLAPIARPKKSVWQSSCKAQ